MLRSSDCYDVITIWFDFQYNFPLNCQREEVNIFIINQKCFNVVPDEFVKANKKPTRSDVIDL